MASSCLESLRQGLEDIENLEKAGAICLTEQDKQASNSRKRALWDHRVLWTARQLSKRARLVLDLFEDADGLRADELAVFAGQKSSQPAQSVVPGAAAPPPPPEGGGREVWRAFYERLKMIQDYYKTFAAQNEFPETRDAAYFVLEAIENNPSSSSIFSVEEAKGKALDLTSAFHNLINCKRFRQHREVEHRQATIARLKRAKFDKLKRRGGEDLPPSIADVTIDLKDPEVLKKLEFHEMDYVRFMRAILSDFRSIPRHCKYRDEQYLKYVTELLDYLRSFYQRSFPLVDHEKLILKMGADFESAWNDHKITYWGPPTCQLTDLYAPATDRLFGTETACRGHMESKKYKRLIPDLVANEEQIVRSSMAHDQELARLEYMVTQFTTQLMSHFVEATIQHVRKKQSRNLTEARTAAAESESSEDEDLGFLAASSQAEGKRKKRGDGLSDSDEEEDLNKKVRNPLNLPLGWDGKPIPYWLYKLHGLGQEFKCEICGNHSYWGRRVFERHFQEWRHAFGMRCLKIPNTLHFKEITKIQDAVTLYQKLKTDTEQKSFLVDQEIEVEDPEGNVMTPQTYEDLRRQGII